MADEKLSVGLRLDPQIYEQAQWYCSATGQTFQELVSVALLHVLTKSDPMNPASQGSERTSESVRNNLANITWLSYQTEMPALKTDFMIEVMRLDLRHYPERVNKSETSGLKV